MANKQETDVIQVRLGSLVPKARPMVTKKVTETVGQKVKSRFAEKGKMVRVKGTRFLPSTRVDLGKGMFQIMANTVIEVASAGGLVKRAKSIDSVVTVARENNSQVLKELNIPSLAQTEG